MPDYPCSIVNSVYLLHNSPENLFIKGVQLRGNDFHDLVAVLFPSLIGIELNGTGEISSFVLSSSAGSRLAQRLTDRAFCRFDTR